MWAIRDLMTDDVISFEAHTPIETAIQTLIDRKISGAPVVDSGGQILGVVSEADILSLYWESQAKVVGDIMTPSPHCFPVDGPVVDVVDCLMANCFRRVLIHDGKNRLVGLVSRADLMPLVLRTLLQDRTQAPRR